MTLTLHTLLLVLAALLFAVAALPVKTGPINLTAAGLCLLTVSFLVP